jgi:hypothetical protein
VRSLINFNERTNYIDETTLTHLSKKGENVKMILLSKNAARIQKVKPGLLSASVPRHAIASGDGMTCSSDQSPLNNKNFNQLLA